MSALPFVGVSTTKEGDTNVLIRQSTNDGHYAVEICLSMEQFSGLMAVLRGPEMYLMDMELRKPDISLLTTHTEVHADTLGDPLSVLEHKLVDIDTQSNRTKKSRKCNLGTIQEENKINVMQ